MPWGRLIGAPALSGVASCEVINGMKNLLRRSAAGLVPALLALSLLVPASASTALPSLRMSWSLLDNHDVKLTVVDANSRAWRLTGAGTGSRANYRIHITVNTGDVSFSGDVSYLRRNTAGDWVAFSRTDISPYLNTKTASIGGCESHLRIRWNTVSSTVQRDGNGTLRRSPA